MEVELEIHVDEKVNVHVHIDDIISSINELPMKFRWNSVANIINGVQLSLSELTDDQRELVKDYLKSKLALF